MRCNKCSKLVPDNANVCPYCNAEVNTDLNSEVNFGKIEDTDYHKKYDLKVFIGEPGKRKFVFGAGIIFVFFIIALVVFVAMLFKNKNEADYLIFTKTLRGLTDIIEDNTIGTNTSKSGKYTMQLTVNGESWAFDGLYAYDIKTRIASLTGNMKDPKEAIGGVIVDDKDLEFRAYLRDNNLYFQSDEIYGAEDIYFLLNDTTGLLSTKNYDLYSLISGSSDALESTLKNMSYKTTEETIVHLGKSLTLTKRTLVLDNKNKLKFITDLLNNLIDDVNFINEYARIKNKKSDEIIKMLENYITTSEYKYSADTTSEDSIAIYFDKKRVYRIEFLIDGEEKKRYQIDVGNTKFYLEYFVNDENVYIFTLATTQKTIGDLTEKNYIVTFDRDNLVTDIIIRLEEDKNPIVKKQDITNFKDIKDFTDEDYARVKNNVSYYWKNTQFVDEIRHYYKEKCVLGMQCVCENELTCSCDYNGTIITCPKELVTN